MAFPKNNDEEEIFVHQATIDSLQNVPEDNVNVDEHLVIKLHLETLVGQTRLTLCDNEQARYSSFNQAKDYYVKTYCVGEATQEEWDVLMLTGVATLTLLRLYQFYEQMMGQNVEPSPQTVGDAAKHLDKLIKTDQNNMGLALPQQTVTMSVLLHFVGFLQDRYVLSHVH